jgi:hypothetical protein
LSERPAPITKNKLLSEHGSPKYKLPNKHKHKPLNKHELLSAHNPSSKHSLRQKARRPGIHTLYNLKQLDKQALTSSMET